MPMIADRQPQLARDREHDAALRGAVELGQHDARHAERFVEQARLLERILSLARVEHQQHFVRRALVDAAHHALHLLQFVHQVRLRVQATCGVGQQHVDAPRAALPAARRRRPQRDRRRWLARSPVTSLRSPQICSCSTAAARNVSPAASMTFRPCCFELPRELADRRRLAGAVDADDQNRERRSAAVDRQRLLRSAAGCPATSCAAPRAALRDRRAPCARPC